MISLKTQILALIAAGTMTLVACAPSHPEDSTGKTDTTATGAQIVTPDDPENDADILADEGEAILSTEHIDEALAKFTEALKLNPKNTRADLWSSYLKAQLEMKGIVGRIRPLIEAQEDGPHRYQRILTEIVNISEPARRQFFLGGSASDIQTMDEFQEWVDRLTLRLDDLRTTVARHKSEEVRLLIPRDFLGSFEGYVDPLGSARCNQDSFGPIDAEKQNCDSDKLALLFSRADFEVFAAAIADYEVTLAMMNTYIVDPTAIPKIQDPGADSKTFVEFVNAAKKLRPKNQRMLAEPALRDFAQAVRYMMTNGSEFCVKGKMSLNSRPGHLISTGLCFDPSPASSGARLAQAIDQFLLSQPVSFYSKMDVRLADVDVHRFIAHPIPDASVLGPMRTPPCTDLQANLTPLQPYVSHGSVINLIGRESLTPSCQEFTPSITESISKERTQDVTEPTFKIPGLSVPAAGVGQ